MGPGLSGGDRRGGGRRLLRAVLRPRARRIDLAVAVLLGTLGFAAVVQVRSASTDSLLVAARPQDLVQILDELSQRSTRLRQEVTSLTEVQRRLASGSGADQAALAEAGRRTRLLGVLAGTVPATGPGVTLTVSDPRTQVSASLLLDAVEELRDAGAEAIQLEGTGPSGRPVPVRVVAATAFADTPAGVTAGGVELTAPYRLQVIGDPGTLAGAIGIPGGIEDAVQQLGGVVTVARADHVVVDALQPLPTPRYARPDR